MMVSGRALACSSLIVVGALILLVGYRHDSNSPNVLVAVDKYGIPVDEGQLTASEMEKTDLLMLQTVRQLQSKVGSLSLQMKELLHHKPEGGESLYSEQKLKEKVNALSKSMLDTIQAVQHLSVQVSQLEVQKRSANIAPPAESAVSSMFHLPAMPLVVHRPHLGAGVPVHIDLVSAMKTTQSPLPSEDPTILNIEANNKNGEAAQKSTADPVSELISRLQLDTKLARSAAANGKSSALTASQKQALQTLQSEIVNLLKPESQVPASAPPSAASTVTQAAKEDNSVNVAVPPALSGMQETDVDKQAEEERKDMSVARLFSGSDLKASSLKARTDAMEQEVSVLAKREHAMLNALPSIEDTISRDRAVLSDGLQSLQIAQDRLVLATKAAEDSDDPTTEATKRLAERREAQIQRTVKEELHRLALAKQQAAEGPALARTLHDRRTLLRHLESQLQRATLLHKARLMESNKDFAG